MINYGSTVRILLKLFGVGLVVYSAVTFSTYIPAIVDNSAPLDWGMVLAHASPTIITCFIGIFLWLFPTMVVNTIVLPSLDLKNIGGEWDTKAERIGVTILGLFLLFRALSDLVFNVASYIIDAPAVKIQMNFQVAMITTIVEFILAVFLMLGSTGITNTIRKLRASN